MFDDLPIALPGNLAACPCTRSGQGAGVGRRRRRRHRGARARLAQRLRAELGVLLQAGPSPHSASPQGAGVLETKVW